MNSSQIIERLNSQFPGLITASFPADKHPRVHVDAANWRAMAQFLRNDPELHFDWLANLSGVDYVADGKMAVVYDLWSFDLRHQFAVKVLCPRDNPHVASVCDLWGIANWHEREAYDLFGIVFDGHPDLRRILLADDWVGYPLRKDYEFPKEYHGIPGTVDLPWQKKPVAVKK